MSKPRVLVLIGALWPGNDSSGPNLSIRALCAALSDAYDFSIVARDRPFGAAVAQVGPGWHDLGFARARYLPVGRFGAEGLGAVIDEVQPDALLLNGFNDREFTIPALIHRRLHRARVGGTLLSPRGEFSTGARALKGMRKTLYRRLAGVAGLLRNVTLQATSEAERDDLTAAFPGARIVLVSNIRPLFDLPLHTPRRTGEPLRIAFLGRISPVKGLDVALGALAKVTAPVRFEIFGPEQDAEHWRGCETLIAKLPAHVSVARAGEVANDDVAATMAAQDVMFLPSRSENFGHAIFESLASGTPVLIGQATPWRGLAAKQAGHDLPLTDAAGLAQAIDAFAAMGAEDTATWRAGARRVAEGYVAASPAIPQMRALIDMLVGEAAT